MIVSVIYRCPSQNSNQFELFLSNLENLLSDINKRKPSLSVVTGDFNAISSSWLCNDINTIEGSHLYSLKSSNGFSQLLNEPAHIQVNSSSCINLIFYLQINQTIHIQTNSSSCINLIVTNQPNLSVNSGAHSSLDPNCHHQIVHTSFNFDINYPPRRTLRSKTIFGIWKPFKKMKNAFYFTLRAFFVLKILKFLSWFLGHVIKRLE